MNLTPAWAVLLGVWATLSTGGIFLTTWLLNREHQSHRVTKSQLAMMRATGEAKRAAVVGLNLERSLDCEL